MTLPDLFLSQLADPFRIGLLIALFITMLRTRAASGVWVPLAAGAVFVAVILPSTMPSSAGLPLMQLVIVGILANVVILAVILGLWTLFQRLRS